MKKLKLRIAKFDRMLVVEQLERTGEWKNSEHVKVQGSLFLLEDNIDLQEDNYDENVAIRKFDNNAERDEYLQNMLGWITEEQFGGSGKLEVGKMCEVSDDEKEWVKRIYAGKFAKQLGEEKRFLAVYIPSNDVIKRWKYAKPINDCLKIEGEVYTWEK